MRHVDAAAVMLGDAIATGLGPLGKQWLTIPAAAAVSSYLLVREVGARSALPVIAGWLLGGSIAAGCAAIYELSEPPRINHVLTNHAVVVTNL
jgi:hypothetical protein